MIPVRNRVALAAVMCGAFVAAGWGRPLWMVAGACALPVGAVVAGILFDREHRP